MTASTLVDRQTPNNLWVMNYNGVMSNKVFANFQWSKKDFGFRNTGGTSTALIDSPFITRGVLAGGSPNNRHFNAPYFDSNDPEDRNNKQFAGSVSYFLTSRGTGRHDLKTGFEHFTSFRNGGNSQSATGYVFRTDYMVGADGKPIAEQRWRADSDLGWKCGGHRRHAPGKLDSDPGRDARHQDPVPLRCRIGGRPATG